MSRIRRTRPSAAFVVAILALVAAVAGVAVAGPTATTSKLDKKEKQLVKKIAKKQANKEITRRAPQLSVASAESAITAETAADANAVDGHGATCPGGTFLHAGACFDTSVRFSMSDWTGGAVACADAGGYLPSTSELMSIRDEPGIDLGGTNNGHWSDSRFQEGATNRAVTVLDNGAVEVPASVANFRQIRCAFKLVR